MAATGFLYDRFRAAAGAEAIVESDGTALTYGDFLDRIAALGARLDAAGVAPGSAVQLRGDFDAQSLAWLFALWQRDCVVTPVAPTSIEMAPEFARTADVAWIAAGEDLSPGPGGSAHPLYDQLRAAPAPGLVIFSSGTAGQQKGAVHNVANLLGKFEKPGKALRTIGFLLFDHISGIDTLLYTLAGGGTLICLGARDPASVCRTIAATRAEVLPTAPSFLNMMMLSGAADGADLSSLKIITYGGEMMPQPLLDRVDAAFPGIQLSQKYGASEIGALRTRSDGGASRWLEIDPAGADWRVREGMLEVKTATAMIGYLNAPTPFTQDGWYQTGDRVETDGARIRFLGRDSDLISVGGQKVYPAEVEAALREIPEVLDAAVFGKAHPMLGASVFARLQVADAAEPAKLRTLVRQALTGRLEPYKIPQKMEFTEDALTTERFKTARR